jgi:hypothetical protein
VACTGVTFEGIGTVGIDSAIVVAGNTLVDLGNAFTIVVEVIALFTFTFAVVTFSILLAFDSVAFVFGDTVQHTLYIIVITSMSWLESILTLALISFAFIGAYGVVTTVIVFITLVRVATFFAVAIPAIITFAGVPVAKVGACCIGITVVISSFTLIFITVWDTFTIFFVVSIMTFAFMTVAFINAVCVRTTVAIVVCALVFITFWDAYKIIIRATWFMNFYVTLFTVWFTDIFLTVMDQVVTVMANAVMGDTCINTVRVSWTGVVLVTLVLVTALVAVTSVTISTFTCVSFACINTYGIGATLGGSVVTLVGSTWGRGDGVSVTFAFVFYLGKEAVPFCADGVGATTAVGTLGIDDGLDLGHDWFVGIIGKVHEMTTDMNRTVAFTLITVPVKVAVEFVHGLGQLIEKVVSVFVFGILSIECGIGSLDTFVGTHATAI